MKNCLGYRQQLGPGARELAGKEQVILTAGSGCQCGMLDVAC